MSAGKLVLFLLAAALPGPGRAAEHEWHRIGQSTENTVYFLREGVTEVGPAIRMAWFWVEPSKPVGFDYYLEQDVIDCARGTLTVVTLINYRKNRPPLKATIINRAKQRTNRHDSGTLGADMVKAACGVAAR